MGRTGGDGIRIREIEYHPLPSQKRFHESAARFKGFSGPIGSGKSQALCQEALKLSYFPSDGLPGGLSFSGMPYYDAWNQSQFESQYGHSMAVITANTVDPASYADEAAFLPTVIGNFTTAVATFVRGTQATCRFEVLYPLDVNQTAWNAAVNYPAGDWTPSALTCLKTESFGFTLGRDLSKAEGSIQFGQSLGFPATQRSHLVGVGDSTTAWLKESRAALGQGFESVVLFALDQFCLIGYEVPLPESLRRSVRMGS